MDGSNRWRTSVRSRMAVVAVTAAGLALWGIFGAGAKAPLVPFQGKAVSTPAADKFSVAESLDGNSLATTGGNDDVVAMGPNHSLYFYWMVRKTGTWYGPLQIAGAGTAYSGPSISVDANNSHVNVAVEGPNHTVLFFWQIGSTWYGPLQIGAAGSTWSAPSLQNDPTTGNVNVAAQGPDGSLYFYWAIGGSWNGPLQVAGTGRVFSAPSLGTNHGPICTGGTSTDSCVSVSVKGPANQSVVYFAQNGTWLAPSTSGANQDYSAASGLFSPSNQASPWLSIYEGPGNSLIDQQSSTQGGANTYCVISGSGTTFAAPGAFSVSSSGVNVYMDAAADGPSGSLYAYWAGGTSQPTSCPAFYGPLQLSGAGTTFSVPALNLTLDTTNNDVANILVEGPSHTLWAYWSSAGTWYGPIQLGGPGTTFDSAS